MTELLAVKPFYSRQISPAEFKKELFMKFYGDDFNAIEREKILNAIGSFVKREKIKSY